MKVILVCMMMMVVSAKADPAVDQKQIEILESTIKEFKKSIKNTDENRRKRILIKIIDSENEIISLYSRLSTTTPQGDQSEIMAKHHNQNMINDSLLFRKTFPGAEETDLIGLLAGKAMERANELEKAESLYKEIIGPGNPEKQISQIKLSITIALVELLLKKQKYGEIQYTLINHPAKPTQSQYGLYLRLLSESLINNEEKEKAFETLVKELKHIKLNQLESEVPESIENYGNVLSKIINDKKTDESKIIDETLPELIPAFESSYLKRLLLTVSIDDKKRISGRLYDQYKNRMKISDRIQLMDIILSQLNFNEEAAKATYQTIQNLMQDLINSTPEDIASTSTNKLNALKASLGKAEKASYTHYQSTKETTPLIFIYSGQLKIENKNEIRVKIIRNLFKLYMERKDLARAGRMIQQLATIKGNEDAALQLSLELDQKEYESLPSETELKLEPKKIGSIAFDPASPKAVILKKWFDHLAAAMKVKSIDSKFLSYSGFELFKYCYLNGAFKSAESLAIQLYKENPSSETAIKSTTLILETYRLDNDRINQNRLADLILSSKSPDSMVKIAKQIKAENIIIQQQELMKSGDHEKATSLAEQIEKQSTGTDSELLVQSRFLSGISLLELKKDSEAVKKLELVVKSNQETYKEKAKTPLAIARFRIAEQLNDLDQVTSTGSDLIQLAIASKGADETLNSITQSDGFAKKLLIYSWMSNHTRSKSLIDLFCAKNSTYPVKSECEKISQYESLKTNVDRCSNPIAMVGSASKIDPLFLFPLTKSIQNCFLKWIGKVKSSVSSVKVSLLDNSITNAAASIKSLEDGAVTLKGFIDPSLYPEVMMTSAILNTELADKIESFKMKGISGAELESIKAQQKQLAEPFRTTAKTNIKTSFNDASDQLTGAKQMNRILDVMRKVDPEEYQTTTGNWKPINSTIALNDVLKKTESSLPEDVAPLIRSNNLKWMTYHFLIRQGSSQNDDAFKYGTLALGTSVYQLASLDSKTYGILEESLYRNFSKPWSPPYLEAAYSSLNSKKTKRACEVLSHEDAISFASHCAWVRP